ncbi:proline reductase-associated electron transfer protein PrdC [Enterococcus sp. AZ072]|uniref:proline reductase-associated electron transfer protein PrdC n=1 Tax=unclassified Enterococcus TaxID=2608891 RepID=UPI003D2E0D1D
MEELYGFALKQGIGASSEPAVTEKDRVVRGQLIARCPDGKLGNNIHSSVSGTVAEINETYIMIEPDEVQSPEYVELSAESPMDRIREAGIIGLGGAGFPTAVKLGHRFENKGTILINASECEPVLSHNIERTEKNPAEIIRGIKIAMELTNATEAIIAIKGYHESAIAALDSELSDKISIHKLPNIYPVGDERAVVRECLDILLEVDQLPLAADAIVINLETVFRIYQAVDLKKPLIDKDLTVAGKLMDSGAIKTYFDMPLGMKFSEMFDLAGGIGKEYGEIIEGGPFMGKRASLDNYLQKTTGGLIASEVFWNGPQKLGLLVCACGAHKERLSQIAESMGSEIAGIEYCKQAIEVKGTLKCTNPGICPGQVQKVMALKKAGAEAVLISNCTDCSNTVMSCAPQLKLPVYHATDGSMRACNLKLVRRMKSTT